MTRQLPRLPLTTQLIGVDGGATRVRAYEVELVETFGEPVLRASTPGIAREWPVTPGFVTPAERGASGADELPPIDVLEQDQAWRRIETTARCVLDVARARTAPRVMLGVAMPGLKTADGRGVAFARHGPRSPDFAERLEHLLASEGVELARPIARLESDGWCAGLGEEHAEQGLLRGVDDAYYVAGGTGLAEALKLGGRLVEFEQLESWLPRAWRLRDPLGEASYDDLLSARGINARYRQHAPDRGMPELEVEGDELAQTIFELTGKFLASLVVARVCALRARGPDSSESPGPHELSRVVVGMRLGRLLGDARTRPWFERSYCEYARELLEQRHLHGVHWTTRISTLSEAPAIGAAASALFEAHGDG